MEETNTELKNSYLGIFSLNYFTQGINQSMFATIIPIYLLQLIGTVDPAEIASIMSLVLLPFGVKFIYGILSDKIGFKKYGRRKPWIIVPSIIAGLIWILIPFMITPSNAMTLVLLAGIIIVIGVAMGDTAIDGLILDLYPSSAIGRVQGICWGFRSVGIIAGGPLLVVFILLTGGIIEFAFIGLGLVMIIFSFFTLLVKETEKSIEVNVIANLKMIFGKIKNWKVFTYSIFNAIADGVIFLFISLFILIQWGLIGSTGSTIDLIGDPNQQNLYAPNAFIALIIGLGVITGAIIGGRFSDLKSRKSSVYLSLLLTTVSLILFLIPAPWFILIIFAFIIGSSAGWRNSAFSAVTGSIAKSFPEMDSTYYATCNSFTNIGSVLGLQLTSLLFTTLVGFSTFTIYAIIFVFMAILVNIGLIPFKLINPKEYELDRE